MLKRNWIVVGVYYDDEGIFQVHCSVLDNTTKKAAINRMYDILCKDDNEFKLESKKYSRCVC